ncbi:hypothetical protein GCM10025795_52410 [Verticiella sediminum]
MKGRLTLRSFWVKATPRADEGRGLRGTSGADRPTALMVTTGPRARKPGFLRPTRRTGMVPARAIIA